MMDVRIACPCPPRDGQTRHPNDDTVTLRERLDFRSVTAIRQAVALIEKEDSPLYAAEILATLTEGYVLYGIESWTLTDEKGKPLPVSKAAIRERVLSDVVTASMVGDAADEQYGEQVLLPLLARASSSSPASPTVTSMSPPTPSGPSRRPKRSRPSSTTTSPTAATVATSTSLDGVSSYSQSSESAA